MIRRAAHRAVRHARRVLDLAVNVAIGAWALALLIVMILES